MSLAITFTMLMGLMAYGLVVLNTLAEKDAFGLAGIIVGVIAIFGLAVALRRKENQLASLS